MFESVIESNVPAVLAQLSGLLDDLQRLEFGNLSGDGVLRLLRELERQKNRLATVDHRLIAEVELRGLARDHGCRDTTTLLSHMLRVSPTEAAARFHAANDMGPRRALSGAVLPPLFERVAAAQSSGAIAAAHARVVTASINSLPSALQDEHEESVQKFLVEQAELLNARQLAHVAHRLCDTLDPDGTLGDERDRARQRDLRIRRRPDGSVRIEGKLTAICTEALLAALEPLAKPVPAQDGTTDRRSAGQRLHDALQDATLLVLRSGSLPDCGGFAATILLTMTSEQLQTKAGLVTTGHGARISADLASTLAGDARIMPVVLGKTKQIAAYGSTHRIFTEGQRLAMIARDLGCSFPGCDQPPSRCQSHHITDYALTRRTSVDDGTLLCGFHHREHPALGWNCQMINGIPHWTAPAWLDPTATPHRNRAHDPFLT